MAISANFANNSFPSLFNLRISSLYFPARNPVKFVKAFGILVSSCLNSPGTLGPDFSDEYGPPGPFELDEPNALDVPDGPPMPPGPLPFNAFAILLRDLFNAFWSIDTCSPSSFSISAS